MHLSTILLFIVLLTIFVLTIIIDAYTKTFSFTSIMAYLFAILAYFLILLDQECISNGPCTLWGWIRFLIAALGFAFLITYKIAEVRTLQQSNKPKEQTVEQLQSF